MTRTQCRSSVGHLDSERYSERSSTYEGVGESSVTDTTGSGKRGEILLHMTTLETENFQIFWTTAAAVTARLMNSI